MKKLSIPSIIAAFALAASGSAHAAAFSLTSVNAASGQYVAIESMVAALMPAGVGYVGVGIFGTDPALTGATPALLADFTAYASGTFGGANVGDADGSVFLSGSDTIGAEFLGQQAYIVFGDALTFGASTQVAVVKDDMFPAVDDPGNPVPVAFDLDLGTELAANGVDVGTLTDNQAIPALDALGASMGNQGIGLIGVVPEPSTGVLGLVGGLLFVFRRRR